jgi:hypothetical protein
MGCPYDDYYCGRTRYASSAAPSQEVWLESLCRHCYAEYMGEPDEPEGEDE